MRKNMKLTGNHLLLCLCITINHLFSVPSPGIRKSIESLTSVKIKLRPESQTKRENWEKEVYFSLMWASVEGQCMALEAAMQLLNLWHLPFGGKLCHPCLIWITELPKTCFKCSWHGGTFILCVRLLFKKKKKKTINAFAKQCLWGYFNYCYCSSKTVPEVLEMVLNLNCQENSSEFGKWGKRDKYFQMPDLFFRFCYQ